MCRLAHCAAAVAAVALVLSGCGSGANGAGRRDGTYRGAFDSLTDARTGGSGGTPLTISFRLAGGHVSQVSMQARIECAGEGGAFATRAGETDLDSSGGFRLAGRANDAYDLTISGSVGADGTAGGRVDAQFAGRCGVDGGSWHASAG